MARRKGVTAAGDLGRKDSQAARPDQRRSDHGREVGNLAEEDKATEDCKDNAGMVEAGHNLGAR